MKSKILTETDDGKIWLLVLETGEEVKKTLEDFAAKNASEAASFVALGAFQRARLGYFQWDKKTYKEIPVDEQVEVITLAGDIVPSEKASPACTPTPCWAARTAARAAAICWKASCGPPWKSLSPKAARTLCGASTRNWASP